jgi:hypothetical protein
MKNGRCPKCGKSEVYHSDAQGIQRGLMTGDGSPYLHLFKDKFVPDVTLLPMEYYVCRECGCFEMYVKEVGNLYKLEDSSNWHKVKPS